MTITRAKMRGLTFRQIRPKLLASPLLRFIHTEAVSVFALPASTIERIVFSSLKNAKMLDLLVFPKTPIENPFLYDFIEKVE